MREARTQYKLSVIPNVLKLLLAAKMKSWNRLYLANPQIKNTSLGWQKKEVMFIHLTYFKFLSVLK